MRRIIVALTGASGAVYCLRLVRELVRQPDIEVHLLTSPTGLRVAEYELGISLPDVAAAATAFSGGAETGRVIATGNDFFAPPASGSFHHEAMVVVPCSGGRLGAFAAGICRDLLDRVVEVTLKERRRLILVHRETPLSRIHLKNMLKLHDAGAMILPATPAFYHHPESVDDIVNFVVSRILDQLGIDANLTPRWGGAQCGQPIL